MPSTAPAPALGQTPSEAGFTLVEVMISVALFGLIALAGFTLLDSELRVQARTDGRMERLGDLQRAMYLMTADFEQMSGPAVLAGPDAFDFSRFAAAPEGGEIQVRYDLKDGVMRRTLGGIGVQQLIKGVSALRWSFHVGGGWQETWPAAEAGPAPRPDAVAIDITLDGADGGMLRRLVALPAPP